MWSLGEQQIPWFGVAVGRRPKTHPELAFIPRGDALIICPFGGHGFRVDGVTHTQQYALTDSAKVQGNVATYELWRREATVIVDPPSAGPRHVPLRERVTPLTFADAKAMNEFLCQRVQPATRALGNTGTLQISSSWGGYAADDVSKVKVWDLSALLLVEESGRAFQWSAEQQAMLSVSRLEVALYAGRGRGFDAKAWLELLELVTTLSPTSDKIVFDHADLEARRYGYSTGGRSGVAPWHPSVVAQWHEPRVVDDGLSLILAGKSGTISELSIKLADGTSSQRVLGPGGQHYSLVY